jgi:hypothetical protein
MIPTPAPAGHATLEASTAKVAVVLPIHVDPDWELFDAIPEDIPLIVCDDSDGKLGPAPRDNVRFFDYAAQRDVMGAHYDAIPHKSAAARNFGHYLAYTEGYDVIIALDYDCRTRVGWLAAHLDALGPVVDAPAVAGRWINTVEQSGFYARGYPYEYRNAEASAVQETRATGHVKLNMGVWDNVLDLNGVDKFQRTAPTEPGLRGDVNPVALGTVPLCGMNTAFAAALTPAYFFLPDVFVEDWHLSRHDDIWGGYVLQQLMGRRGDLVRFGRPVVEHTRQSTLERVVVMEHYMHLMSGHFYALVDSAVDGVRPGPYGRMFGDLAEAMRSGVERAAMPAHYRNALRELIEAMQRWARCFR